MSNWIGRLVSLHHRRVLNDKIVGHVYGMIWEYTLMAFGLIVVVSNLSAPDPDIALAMILLCSSAIIGTIREIERDRRIRAAGLEGTEEF